MGGQCHVPTNLFPGKTQCSLLWRLGKPQGRSGQLRKISPPPGFDPRTVLIPITLSLSTTLSVDVLFFGVPVYLRSARGKGKDFPVHAMKGDYKDSSTHS